MDIPIDTCSEAEILIDGREEVSAQDWRDERLDGLIKDKCEQDFVDVIR